MLPSYLATVTVLDVIQKSADFLAKKGVESPRLQVELLLAHVLKLPRMKLYLNFDRVLTNAELDELRELIKRRGNREPLQHIVGTTSFCGLEIKVTEHVLIPRPETEILAELGWKFLSTITSPRPIALDFATGSGCLAIALAARCANSEIHALDISAEALAVARDNAARHHFADRIIFHQSDAFSALPKDLRFDLIVANPPYIPTAEIATLEPEVRDFDPRLALDGGVSGLDFYQRLATGGLQFLRAAGRIMLEFGDGQATALADVFQRHNWNIESIEKDYTQRERFLIASPK